MNEAIIEQKSREMYQKIKNAKPDVDIPKNSKKYYLSNEGNDKNDGLTPETAIATLEALERLRPQLKYGDAVLFRCGDVFRGKIIVSRGILYSSYGEGEKPKLYGSPENMVNRVWKKERENVYSISVEGIDDIGNIIFNGGEEWAYKKSQEGDTEVLMDKDFYHDFKGEKLYLYSEKGNPSKRWKDIEIAPRTPIINDSVPSAKGTADGCTIDGLVIKYSGGCAFNIMTSYDVCVLNCEFEWIGGSLMFVPGQIRLGNAFQVWGFCSGIKVENCYFNQIYDAAITQQWSGPKGLPIPPKKVVNVVIKDCLFENNTYDYEYFLTEFEEDRSAKLDTKLKFENILFEGNICRKAGYGWGSQRPDHWNSTHIKSWKHVNNAENFIIRNNIFDRSDYSLIEIKAHLDECVPKLERNIYCQYKGKGWINGQHVNSKFTDDTIKNPTANGAEEDAICIFAVR